MEKAILTQLPGTLTSLVEVLQTWLLQAWGLGQPGL